MGINQSWRSNKLSYQVALIEMSDAGFLSWTCNVLHSFVLLEIVAVVETQVKIL